MGSYFKQIEVTPSLMMGKRFPIMLEAVKNEAKDSRWEHYGWRERMLAAPTFTHAMRIMGMTPIYEGDDIFTVDVDGMYDSVFFWPMLKRIAPYMNPGRIVVRVENVIEEYRFQDGDVYYSAKKLKSDEDE